MDDIELPEGDRIQFVKDGLKHKLIIKDSCIDDEGIVTAQIGDKKSTASLFVQGMWIHRQSPVMKMFEGRAVKMCLCVCKCVCNGGRCVGNQVKELKYSNRFG